MFICTRQSENWKPRGVEKSCNNVVSGLGVHHFTDHDPNATTPSIIPSRLDLERSLPLGFCFALLQLFIMLLLKSFLFLASNLGHLRILFRSLLEFHPLLLLVERFFLMDSERKINLPQFHLNVGIFMVHHTGSNIVVRETRKGRHP